MNIDPKKISSLMKQMGIAQEEIKANRVIIERDDGKIIIENPSVLKIKLSGNVSWQITGDEREEIFSEEDIKMIMEKTGASRDKIIDSLKRTNDIAETILELS
ncbi:MAG: NAC domain-containing protein [Candidatus Pacearchaeota archaeon]